MTRWIFKILRPHEWQAAQADKNFAGAPVDVADGFIHFSTQEQVSDTAEKHFADAPTVHLLAFDTALWPDDTLKWEPSRGGALFPHVYDTLDVTKARHLWHLRRDSNGGVDMGAIDLSAVGKWMQEND